MDLAVTRPREVEGGAVSSAGSEGRPRSFSVEPRTLATWLPVLAAAAAFLVLFAEPLRLLLRDWWYDPEAGHGLLLGPLAIFLAWRSGLAPVRRPRPATGLAVLLAAVALRYLSGLAAELFTMRASMLLAVVGGILFFLGWSQIRRWWLPLTLFALSIPLPAIVLSSLAFPLQLKASQFGAALLELRYVPVQVAGNVIHLPGRTLFVTEACSGLRSLTSLIALGVLIGGLWLRTPVLRILLVLLAIPMAMLLNGVRIFLTGFLVYFVDPSLGEGFMHYTEGWATFAIAFAMLGATAWLFTKAEAFVRERRT